MSHLWALRNRLENMYSDRKGNQMGMQQGIQKGMQKGTIYPSYMQTGKGIQKGFWVNTQAGNGAKGARGGKGAGKKRKAPSVPAGPLDPSVLEKVAEFIVEHGGAVTLGKLSTTFEGLKKVQVMDHFDVEEAEDKTSADPVVSVPLEGPRQSSFDYEELAPKAKQRREKDLNAPPPPELDAYVVSQITEYIEANGGCAIMGKLCSNFPGLKKAQLESHFEMAMGEKDFSVALPGSGFTNFAPTSAAETAEGHGKKKNKKNKKDKRERDPNAPPPPALQPAAVQQIIQWLNSMGGSAALGKVTTQFPGVKKAQLEGESRFEVSQVEDNRTGDPTVSVA